MFTSRVIGIMFGTEHLDEPLSKLLVSPLISPIIVPYIIPHIIPPLRSLDYSSNEAGCLGPTAQASGLVGLRV